MKIPYTRPPKDDGQPARLPEERKILEQAMELIVQYADPNDGQTSARIFLVAAGTLLRMNGSEFQAIHAVMHNVHPLVRQLFDELTAPAPPETEDDSLEV